MTDLTTLSSAHAQFSKVLGAVDEAAGQRSTPCGDWSVRDLVGHVIGGERMAVGLLAGGTVDDARALITEAPPAGNLREAFAAAAAACSSAFAATGAMEMIRSEEHTSELQS